MNGTVDRNRRDDPTLGLCVLLVLAIATATLLAQTGVVAPGGGGGSGTGPSSSLRSGGTDGVGEIDNCAECRGNPIVVIAPPGAADEVSYGMLGGGVVGPMGEPVFEMDAVGDISSGSLALFLRFSGVSTEGAGVLIVGFDVQNMPIPGGTLVPTMDLVLPLQPDMLGRWILATSEPVPVPLPDGLVLFAQGWFTQPNVSPSLSEAAAIVFGP